MEVTDPSIRMRGAETTGGNGPRSFGPEARRSNDPTQAAMGSGARRVVAVGGLGSYLYRKDGDRLVAIPDDHALDLEVIRTSPGAEGGHPRRLTARRPVIAHLLTESARQTRRRPQKPSARSNHRALVDLGSTTFCPLRTADAGDRSGQDEIRSQADAGWEVAAMTSSSTDWLGRSGGSTVGRPRTSSNALSMYGPSMTGLWQQAIVVSSSCCVRST